MASRAWADPTTTTAGATAAQGDPAGSEFFEKRVRPLLVARCHGCHGAQKQKGNLRLDARDSILAGGDTGPAVVPFKPEESLLVDAIRYGEMYQMPPKSQLPAEEVATLVQWVRIGAPWGVEAAAETSKPAATFDLQARAGHWSFRPLSAADPPAVSSSAWIRTPVDRFILAGLAAAGVEPAPPAHKAALLRRVTYDLIGLPPTPAEFEAFATDDSPGAYAKVVERLLSSPHYGERWARHWLDLVRFAETCGHEFDYDLPNAWRYRDYVIRAFNDDLPYDQFVVEHVAGDLLASPRWSDEQVNESIIATGFFFAGEAKHSPVDVRQDEADRIDNQIDVFAKAFLGLTVSCARCHDHKFDPISTKDYYALAGYLQSSRYQQAYIDSPARLADAVARLKQLRLDRQRLGHDFARRVLVPQVERLAADLLDPAGRQSNQWTTYLRETAVSRVDDPWHPWAVLAQSQADEEAASFNERRTALLARLKDQLAAASSGAADVIADFGQPSFDAWQPSGAAFGDSTARPLEWMTGDQPGRVASGILDAAAHSGRLSEKLQGVVRSPTFEITRPKIFYRLYGTGGEVRLIVDGLRLIQNPIYGGLKFAPGGRQPHWHEQDVSKWIGHRAYIEVIDDGDGWIALEKVVCGDAGAPPPAVNRLVLQMLDDDALSSVERLAQKYQSLFQRALAVCLERSDVDATLAAEHAQIVNALLHRLAPADALLVAVNELSDQAAALDERRHAIDERIAPPRLAMALADGTAENEHVFIRGSHKTPGPEVPRRFLEVLDGTRHAPPDTGSGRLQLAEQMVSPANPLLPRVIVNRLWQHHFGEGIVRSVDDFGAMGQPPTDPALLDFLAGELVREGWSLKQMHRLMVLSSTYQMSSQPQPLADRLDPQNKLWHRMTVRRLEAEGVRDAILAVSGRLDRALYGPSVMPYLTSYMTGRGRPTASGPLDGDGRRSIYLAVRRNFLSPLFLAFDYPIPFTTIGRRGTSNVPAQALAMMNNPLLMEQARLWATRVLAPPDRTAAERVREMYLTALTRPPEPAEQQAALIFLEQAGGGSSTNDPQAWADFAHVLFNVKEFIFIP